MLDRLKTRLVAWRDYRQTARELRHLPNWVLDDIGIARADIKCWAREGRTLGGN